MKRKKELVLPLEYKPLELRPRPQSPKRPKVVMYAFGYEEKLGSFGMEAGPTAKLRDMLEKVPREERTDPCIVRFNLDGTDEVLYRWGWVNGVWYLVGKI